MNIAIVPARGGSKRIPRKNIREFAGLPMIAHPLRVARESKLFDRIIVSTDSPEIAEVAVRHGGEVPFIRPAELADDFSGTDAVLVHALEWCAENGIAVEHFCCIYPTAPFIRSSDLTDGLRVLETSQAATVFPVTTYPYPIFRSVKINDQGRAEMFWPENFPKRSQDFPTAYHDAGQFYWGHAKRYLEEPRLFATNSVPLLIPRMLVQDIDTPEDWDVAEQMYLVLRATGRLR